MIYVITTMRIEDVNKMDWKNHRSRTVGWWTSLGVATDIVLGNYGDIHEGDQNYVVIEGMERGLYPDVPSEHWFKWEDGGYVTTSKPRCFRNVYNFGIG